MELSPRGRGAAGGRKNLSASAISAKRAGQMRNGKFHEAVNECDDLVTQLKPVPLPRYCFSFAIALGNFPLTLSLPLPPSPPFPPSRLAVFRDTCLVNFAYFAKIPLTFFSSAFALRAWSFVFVNLGDESSLTPELSKWSQ